MKYRSDADLFLLANSELESDEKDEALWAKCLAKSDYDDARAKAKYVKARVAELKSVSRKNRETELGLTTTGQLGWKLGVILIAMTLTSLVRLRGRESLLIHIGGSLLLIGVVALVVGAFGFLSKNRKEYVYPRRGLVITLWLIVIGNWLEMIINDV